MVSPSVDLKTDAKAAVWHFPNPLVLVLFFVSGFAALVYEVLWLKELGLLFGNTAYAAATTLAVFFLGLSVGGYVWGKKAAKYRSPLRVYAFLEFGIAVSALLYFLILDIYHLIYAPLFTAFGDYPWFFTIVKFLLACGVLFIPSFLMGGTLPVMGQHLIRHSSQLARTGSLLYAINTSGAALGAFVAAFYLPLALGFRNSYLLAISLSAGIGIVAYLLSRLSVAAAQASPSPASPPASGAGSKSAIDSAAQRSTKNGTVNPWHRIGFIAFFSGFTTLSLEVLWTRMFAQVLQNSVYTFATILIVFLVALALGAVLANGLSRCKTNPSALLCLMLTLGGILVGCTPLVFNYLTNGLEYLNPKAGWADYVSSVFGNTAVVLLVPGIFIGAVFPYLLRLSRDISHGAGQTIGRLSAINTLGAIFGSVTAGFLLLNAIGLWASIRLIAILYFLLAVFVLDSRVKRRVLLRAFPITGLILCVSLLDVSRLPVIRTDPNKETVLDLWEGSHGTVAVVRQGGSNLMLRVNNHYTPGQSDKWEHSWRQTIVPMCLHPNPKSVFFLGLATGMTAGAALAFPVERVVVCELVPDVVTASRKHFGPYTNGLFKDERVRIIIEDGRNYLAGTPERYDIIIAELFLPWKAGIGSLYAREHFATVKSRLNEGGVFAQWLPLYQFSREEFSIVAQTMLDVFPQVTLWRADFARDEPAVALIGHAEATPLDPAIPVRTFRHLDELMGRKSDILTEAFPFLLYAGNLTAVAELFRDYQVNTDDRPVIEYLAPMTQRKQAAGELSWLTSTTLLEFFDELLRRAPPETDPFLAELSPRQLRYVHDGITCHTHNYSAEQLLEFLNRAEAARMDNKGVHNDEIPKY